MVNTSALAIVYGWRTLRNPIQWRRTGGRGGERAVAPSKYSEIFMVLQDPGNSRGQISISIPYLDI